MRGCSGRNIHTVVVYGAFGADILVEVIQRGSGGEGREKLGDTLCGYVPGYKLAQWRWGRVGGEVWTAGPRVLGIRTSAERRGVERTWYVC